MALKLVKKAVLGGDPGRDGGLVGITEDGQVRVWRTQNFTHVEEAAEELKEFCNTFNVLKAGYEAVHAIPRDRKKLARAFTFAKNTGRIIGWMDMLGVDVEYIQIAEWQRHYGVYGLASSYELMGFSRSQAETRAKTTIYEVAQQHIASVKFTKDVADAMLICKYVAERERLCFLNTVL